MINVIEQVKLRRAAADAKTRAALPTLARRLAANEDISPAEIDKAIRSAAVEPDALEGMVEVARERIREIEQYRILRDRGQTFLRIAEEKRSKIQKLEKDAKESETKARQIRAELNSLSGALPDAAALRDRLLRGCPDAELLARRANIMERIREADRATTAAELEIEVGETRFSDHGGNLMPLDAVGKGHRNDYPIRKQYPLPAAREAELRELIARQAAAKADLQAELVEVETAMLEK